MEKQRKSGDFQTKKDLKIFYFFGSFLCQFKKLIIQKLYILNITLHQYIIEQQILCLYTVYNQKSSTFGSETFIF